MSLRNTEAWDAYLLPGIVKWGDSHIAAGRTCGHAQALCCHALQEGLETPFSRTLAMAGSLEGPETPHSVDSMVRSLFWHPHMREPDTACIA